MAVAISPRAEHPGPPRASARLEPQELILSFFAAFREPPGRPVRSTGLVSAIGEFGFSSGAAKVAVNRATTRGLIVRTKVGRNSYCAATERLNEVIAVGDKRIGELARPPEWDGTWTLVWNSLPDGLRKERHRLSRRLRFLGFGPLEDSVWVAAGRGAENVRVFASATGIAKHITVFETVAEPVGLDAVVARAWDVEELRDRYIEFVEEYKSLEAERLSDDQAFVKLIRAFNTFRRFPYLDPLLPGELVPVEIEREDACTLFSEIRQACYDRAARHFLARTE